ncbi:MAG: ABC transporter substrate-binding protein [Propionibacteriaceae bacterium]|jgi:peptide/nickel transport system substrate-binding protein|nr:ABC transporter substrate-binding protein [Propionibacteriaceae bacterium]
MSRRHPPRLARLTSTLTATALVLTLAACSSGDSGSGPDSGAATSFTWGVETEPASFNPFLNSQDAAVPILRNLYDSYLYLDGDGVYHPWLAQSYEISEDRRTISLTIRPGVTFADGEPLDADAAVLNLERTQDPAIVESTNWAVNLERVEKVDEYTFAIVLSEPDVRVLERLASIAGSPISPQDFDLGVDELKFGVAVHGTGPYAVARYDKGQQLVLQARSEYNWAPERLTGRNGPAHIADLTYRFLAEASTRTGALAAGQVDAIDSVPSQDVGLFQDASRYSYVIEQNAGTPYTLYFNVSRAPFDDVRVRRAIQKAVDLEQIVRTVYNGQAEAAKSPISPVTPFYDQTIESYLTPDVELANRLLDEAGWTGRDAEGYRVDDAGQRLALPLFSNSRFVRDSRDILNQAIAAAVKEALALDYTWQSVDSGTWSERRESNDYVAWDNSLNSGDIASALATQYSSDPAVGFINLGQIKDPKVDQLLAQGQQNYDLATRREAYTEFQRYVLEEQAYVLPLYVLRNSYASTPEVTGFLFDPARGNNWGSYNITKPA